MINRENKFSSNGTSTVQIVFSLLILFFKILCITARNGKDGTGLKEVFNLPESSSLRGLPGKKAIKIFDDGMPKPTKKSILWKNCPVENKFLFCQLIPCFVETQQGKAETKPYLCLPSKIFFGAVNLANNLL